MIDDSSNPAGAYWLENIPGSRVRWRHDYAVKTVWNTNGKYVEYEVPEGPGLKVWRGEASAQQLQEVGSHYPGGGQQIWMPPSTITPTFQKVQGGSMDSTCIDNTLARSFHLASAELITQVRDAIDAFYASPPQGWQGWDAWRTPKPWEGRALPNLLQYHESLEAAIKALESGDIMPITLAAANYAGISKDLDLDRSWMTERHQAAINQAVEKAVAVADHIHRMGYDA